MINNFTNKLRIIIKLIRLRPFGDQTSQERANERHRRIVLTGIGSVGARIIKIISTIISIRLTLDYLGTERFGLWMTISSVIMILGFTELGVGNSMTNKIAKSYGLKDEKTIQKYISNGLAILMTMVLALLIIFFLIYPFVNWANFFKVSSTEAISEAGPAVMAFILCFLLYIPSGIIHRIQKALQLGYISYFWQAIENIFSLIFLVFVIEFKYGLQFLILAITGPPIFFAAINSFIFLNKKNLNIKPKLEFVNFSTIKELLKLSILFLILQITTTIEFASDNFLLARLLGMDAVAEYSIVSKLFESGLVFISMLLFALWPAYREAESRGDYQWIKKALKRSIIVTLFFSISFSCFVVTFHKNLFQLWIGDTIIFNKNLVFLYAIWSVIKSVGNTIILFLYGINKIKFQVIVFVPYTIIVIFMKYLGINYLNLLGIPIALILTYIVMVIPPFIYKLNEFSRVVSTNKIKKK